MKLLIALVLCFIALSGCVATKPPYPDNEYFQQAEVSFLRGDYQTAIDNYLFFIIAQPTSKYLPEAYYRIGLGYLALDNTKDALSYLNDALSRARRPQLKTQINNSLGLLYFSRQDYAQASKYYKKVLKGDKTVLTLAEVYYNLGISLMRDCQWSEGKKYLQLVRDNAGDNQRLVESTTERLSMPPDTFAVQLGRFDNKDNAIAYRDELAGDKGIKVSVNIMLIEGQEFYYIWAGMFPTYAQAVQQSEDLRERGLEAIVMP